MSKYETKITNVVNSNLTIKLDSKMAIELDQANKQIEVLKRSLQDCQIENRKLRQLLIDNNIQVDL